VIAPSHHPEANAAPEPALSDDEATRILDDTQKPLPWQGSTLVPNRDTTRRRHRYGAVRACVTPKRPERTIPSANAPGRAVAAACATDVVDYAGGGVPLVSIPQTTAMARSSTTVTRMPSATRWIARCWAICAST
jgi:hypothetical protein